MSMSSVAKGDLVVMLGFTGMNLGEFKVEAITKSQIHLLNKKNDKLIFDRETGVQKNVAEGKEKYANKLVLPEDAPANKAPKAKAAPAKAATPAATSKKKVAAPVEEDDEEEVVPNPKVKARETVTVKKTASKKSTAAVEDEDEYEEM